MPEIEHIHNFVTYFVERGNMQQIKNAGKTIEIIQKDNISVSIDSLGAKVLAINIDDENILFYDENDIKHSGIPICMPFFGPLRDGILKVEDKEYKIDQHGFFRDSEFDMYKAGGKIVAILKSTNETMKIWPYQFNFRATFEIVENGLKMNFIFKNKDTLAMNIAPGFHPYFAVKNREEVYITTKSKTGNDSLDNFQETTLEETGVFEVIDEKDGIKKLHIQKAPNIQLIDHQLQETAINPGNDSEIILCTDMNIFNRMTVWRPKLDVAYICIEPSFVENAVNTGNGITLESGKVFETSISIIKNK